MCIIYSNKSCNCLPLPVFKHWHRPRISFFKPSWPQGIKTEPNNLRILRKKTGDKPKTKQWQRATMSNRTSTRRATENNCPSLGYNQSNLRWNQICLKSFCPFGQLISRNVSADGLICKHSDSWLKTKLRLNICHIYGNAEI